MKKEDKKLLLMDLSARLPYKAKVFYEYIDDLNNKTYGYSLTLNTWCINELEAEKATVKPYLRPMSSMTEEEKKNILQLLNINGDIDNEGNLILSVECNIITLKVCKKYLGELNKRMFDVCHIIEKGLALEAPKGMYKIN